MFCNNNNNNNNRRRGKHEGKLCPCPCLEAVRGGRGVASLILNLMQVRGQHYTLPVLPLIPCE